MAETVLIPVATQILDKLRNLAMEQVSLLWTLQAELQKLKDTVSTIHAVLRDAEEKQSHNHQVKDWLEKLSEEMYNADDLLDDFAMEARWQAAAADDDDDGSRTTCCSVVSFLFSSLPRQLIYGLKMARDIKAIREKLDVISKDKESFHLEVRSDGEQAVRFRKSDSCPPTIVVGREADKQNVIHLLLNPNCGDTISVVSIVGMGGLGKTTLAQLVFDDQEVKAHFEIKVWLYVSQRFDLEEILRKLLQPLTGQSHVGLELEHLQAQLREKIKQKKFLFVLDDVWEENLESWESLGKYLTGGDSGSKLLVTTRSMKVAEVAGEIMSLETSTKVLLPYFLKGLSSDESWSLMVKKALHGRDPQNPAVEGIGRRILERCCGVPLAVSTLAGLLSSKHPETEWLLFLQNEFRATFEESNAALESTLELSFSHLPSRLKHCFTYCKLFPKSHAFRIQELVQLWVAQGYVESGDQGLQSFKMLWWRSFFQEVETDEFGNLLTCRMHDLMHDLAASITGPKILRSSSMTVLRNMTSKTRHLAVTQQHGDPAKEGNDGVLHGLGDGSKVRTLMSDLPFTRQELEKVLPCFSRLRVLTMFVGGSDSDSDSHSSELLMHFVGGLKHLRFLGFSSEEMLKLPESVTNLLNLAVLDLSKCWSLTELPTDIRKLVSLKHIYLDRNRVKLMHMPEGIGELKSLQTLPVFMVGKAGGLEELKGLNALRGELAILNLVEARSVREGVHVLKEKVLLQSLVLDWGSNDGAEDSVAQEKVAEMLCPHPNLKKLVIRKYGGVNLPNWLSDITNLVEISLEDCKECEYLPPLLHQLPYLKKLSIRSCPKLKGISTNYGHHVDDDPDSAAAAAAEEEDWPRFPCLTNLSIEGCPNLTRMPTFPSLESELFMESSSLEPLVQTLRTGKDTTFDDESAHHHPLSKLRKLSFRNSPDAGFESLPKDSFSSLISLQVLTFSRCRGGAMLPNWLCSISNLREFHLCWNRRVEYLPPLHELPSLAKLVIMGCWSLKGWAKKKPGTQFYGHPDNHYFKDVYYYNTVSLEEEEEEAEWPHFPCLSHLEIHACPNLNQMPLFPTVEGELKLVDITAQGLVETMEMTVGAPLSKLTSLRLGDIYDLQHLPEEGLRNLASLQVLQIEKCTNLACLPPAMRCLTSLQKLIISGCPLLTERCREGNGEDWPNISHIPNIQLNDKAPFLCLLDEKL